MKAPNIIRFWFSDWRVCLRQRLPDPPAALLDGAAPALPRSVGQANRREVKSVQKGSGKADNSE